MSRKKKVLFEGKYSCDGGSLMIYSKDFCVSFNNGIGDGEWNVTVLDQYITNGRMSGHVEVKEENSVFISDYDCKETPLFALPKGHFFVHRVVEHGEETGDMILQRFNI